MPDSLEPAPQDKHAQIVSDKPFLKEGGGDRSSEGGTPMSWEAMMLFADFKRSPKAIVSFDEMASWEHADCINELIKLKKIQRGTYSNSVFTPSDTNGSYYRITPSA